MHPALSSALRTPRFAPLPESAAAALRLLADNQPGWQELAGVAARDAAFSHALLAAAPLCREEWNRDLAPLLARRLEQLGGDLLRAWLLHAEPPPAQLCARERILNHSLMAAQCAMRLAIEMGYPRPQEAYLAGLWHDLGRLWLLVVAPDYAEYANGCGAEQSLAAEERRRYGEDHAALAARLAAEGGAPIHLVDAIALHHALEEQAASAHPLATLVWAAEALASEEHDKLLAAVSRVTGLSESALLGLRADACHLALACPAEQGDAQAGHASLDALLDNGMAANNALGLVPAGRTPTPPASLATSPSDYWRKVALHGLLRGSFSGIAAEQAGHRLNMACRLLFGRVRPFVISVESGGQLIAAPVPGLEDTSRLFDEFQLRLDDEASVVALAARTGATTSHFPGAHSPGRSPRDWHLARWLAAPGLLCLPCRNGQDQYVAVFGIDEHLESGAPEQSLMGILAASAAAVLLEQSRREAADAALQAAIEQRYRDHARRIVHEVKNPLTVIRSYLGMVGQRTEANEALRGELGVINKELDRVASLLQGVVQAPSAVPEPPCSSIADVLQELRTLYGEPLFARRNIDLDLRTVAGLPPARIPPSVLKQVLLNLFRNASEALLDGGKLTVSTPGTLVADGVPCVEIRLIDNGPGIPAERLAHLFEARASAKPGHQGVGLSICRELLAAWQASLLCRSQAGAGTSFQIFIPLDQRT